MKTLTLVKFETSQEWNVIDKKDVVESFYNDSLKLVSKEIIEKYNLTSGDSLDKFENENEDLQKELDEDLSEASYAETYFDSYIRLDSIKEDSLYFDDYNLTFFSGEQILADWVSETYYWYSDGSNWDMLEIEKQKEIEVKEIETKDCDTGYITIFELEGKRFEVKYSFYQGSIPHVLENYTELID